MVQLLKHATNIRDGWGYPKGTPKEKETMVDTNAIMNMVGNEINWLVANGAPRPEAMEIPLGSYSTATITLLVFSGTIVQTPQPIVVNGVNMAKSQGQLTTYAVTPDRLKANPGITLVELRKWGLVLGDWNTPVQYNPVPVSDPPKQQFIDDVVGALDPNRKGPRGELMFEPTPGPYVPTPGGMPYQAKDGHWYVCVQVTQGFGGIIRWMRMN